MVNDELKTLPTSFGVYWKRRLKNYPKNIEEYQSKENALIDKGKGFYYYKVGNKEIAVMYISHLFIIKQVYNELKEAFNS